MTRIISRRFAGGASLALSLIVLLTVCTPHRLQAEFLENWFQAQPSEIDPTGAWTVAATDTGSGNVLQSVVLFTKGGGWIGTIQGEGSYCPQLSTTKEEGMSRPLTEYSLAQQHWAKTSIQRGE
jgi:hypothetical protein